MAATEASQLVVVGRIGGAYGVRGWVRVLSHTEPRENILGYRNWHLQRNGRWEPVQVAEGKPHGKGLIVRLEGVGDPERARLYEGLDVAVPRSELPTPKPGEYYWADLQGLRVTTTDGVPLGTVDHLFETGANDVLVVRGEDRERLLPFVQGQVVKSIDLASGTMTVDWDPEF